jgi:hypothetical protein
MNSTSRRTSNPAADAVRAAALAALLLSVPSAAMAQANLNIPGMAAAPPPPPMAARPPAPAAAAPAPVDLPATQMPMAEAPAAPARPAMPPMPAVTAPPGVAQPAPPAAAFVPNRQVDGQLDKAQAEAVKRLNQVSPEGLASADPAAIGGDLERMNAQQRKLKEREDAKIGQPPPGTASAPEKKGISQEEVSRLLKAEREKALKEADEIRAAKEKEELALGPRPVVAQILGTGKRREAVVMLPCDRGSITVRPGNRLSQGEDPMRVLSISESGVEVEQRGNRFYLGFGNVSSKCAPGGGVAARPAQSASASSFGVQVPVMSAPLPIAGPSRMR